MVLSPVSINNNNIQTTSKYDELLIFIYSFALPLFL